MDIRVECDDCGWLGKKDNCIKGYRDNPALKGDVLPYLQCPRCGGENLIELTPIGEEVLAFA